MIWGTERGIITTITDGAAGILADLSYSLAKPHN